METRLGSGLDALFRPSSIAIIGASKDPSKIGGRPLSFLLKHGFEGRIYPINPAGGVVQSIRAYVSLADLPETPDLAIIAVSAADAVAAVEQCANMGVRAAVVLSSGFTEHGEEGARLQARLSEVARESGMRVLGPNCLGSLGVAERSVATFSLALEAALPAPGKVAIVSQSGNLASYTMQLAARQGVGISRFMTTGNESDIDVADGIAWLASDPSTDVILCCMETCRDAAKLAAAFKLAHEAGKPVVVLKIGSSDAGGAAAASHTGALVGADAVFDVVFRNAGVVRVPNLERMVDLAHALSVATPARLPRGSNVVLLAASGGFSVMMADSAQAAGLGVPVLEASTQNLILSAVPLASARNPVDATAQISSNPQVLDSILSAVSNDPACDAAILFISSALFVPRLQATILHALREVRSRHPDKLILLCCGGPPDVLEAINAMGYPTIEGVDAACATLASLVAFGRRRGGWLPAEPALAAPFPTEAFRNEHGAKAVLRAAGLPVLDEQVATSARMAAEMAAKAGFPVVLKILSPDIPHKTEVGGVAVGLSSREEVEHAYRRIMAGAQAKAPHARIDGVLVAPMVSGGTELILGVKHDPIFGQIVMVGMGGIFAEVMEDVALQVAPIDRETARAMIRSLKAYPVLDGARGREPADIDAAAAALSALSHFAHRHANDIGEIDINPLLVRPRGQGAVVLDALFSAAAGRG